MAGMSGIQIALGVADILVCLFLIVVIMLQESKQQGLGGAVSGSVGETFFDKNKKNTMEAKLAGLTKVAAVLVVVLSIALAFVF